MRAYTGTQALSQLVQLVRQALDAKQDRDQAVTLAQVEAAVDQAVNGAVEEAY
ncbi:MAG: hypothetical protein HFG00_10180 [Oscillibacter sp.]|nr:hypothetical protein [Oscillibacter sp.]